MPFATKMAAAASALTSLSATEMRRAAGQEGAADLRWAMPWLGDDGSGEVRAGEGEAGSIAAALPIAGSAAAEPAAFAGRRSRPTKKLTSTSRTAVSRQRCRRLGGPAKEQRRQATQQARSRRASRAGGATRRADDADGDSASGGRSIADWQFSGHEHAELRKRRLGGGAACGVAASTDVEVDDQRPGGGAAPGDEWRQGTGGAATEPSGRWLERVTPFSPSKWDRLVRPILADHFIPDLERIFPSRFIPSHTSLHPNNWKNGIDPIHPTNQTPP
uniref:Uncharacterized protein n=1 Tax=Oryza meridionalis TaxID=40149 RepID=A0A0E0EP58_9ORYZ